MAAGRHRTDRTQPGDDGHRHRPARSRPFGSDPVAALRAEIGDEDGIEEFFTPESYLGEAEDIRRTILATIDSSGPQEIDLPSFD